MIPGAARWLLAAMMLQGVLTFALLWMLGNVRLPLIARGHVQLNDIALSKEGWPDNARRVSNAFDNQFQLPMLFYVASGISLYFGTVWYEALLAGLFFVSRVVHATVFVVTNHVQTRFVAFTIGFVILIAFWIELATRLLGQFMGGR